MSRYFATPSDAQAYYLGMSTEAFERMCDQEAEFEQEVEENEINLDPENPRFIRDLDLSVEDIANEENDWFIENLDYWSMGRE